MYNNYNRRRNSTGFLVPVLAGLAIGNAVTGIYNSHRAHDMEDFADHVQAYNQQVASQLADDYPSIDGLVLHHDGKTLTFTMSKDGAAETCKGQYEVKAEHAEAIGTIACTATTKVEQ